MTASLALKEVNWLGDQSSLQAAAAEGVAVLARVRSTREPAAARLRLDDGAPVLVFDQAEEGVSPGQACVLYDAPTGDRVLGGGFIATTTAAG